MMLLQLSLIWTFTLTCVHGENLTVNILESCVVSGDKITLTAVYTGGGTVTGVEWFYSRQIASSVLISASTCKVFGSIDAGYPPASRMTFQCPINGLPTNTFKLVIIDVTKQEIESLWGAAFSISGLTPTGTMKTQTEFCVVFNCDIVWKILCGIAVSVSSVVIILKIVFLIIGPQGNIVFQNLSRCDVAALVVNSVVFLYSLIVGAIAVAKNDGCRNCTSPNCDNECHKCLGLSIATIVLAVILLVLAVILVIFRQGWCGERLTCLNTVLPVCKDTEARGPPDGKSDNPAGKEKQREVKLLTHKEQTQQHHKETVVNKGKHSGEKHEEPSKGQPRPLPVPTGNNRPMPEIPSDRHKRGLSANFNDDSDKPVDDNILHTLPVVKKPKNSLDPMNDEGKSKNSDDQPKKKKKKKKDRDTSRSEEMEDDIDSHGKVLAF